MNKLFMLSPFRFIAFGKRFAYDVNLLNEEITFSEDCGNIKDFVEKYSSMMERFFKDDANNLLDIIDDFTGKSYSISYSTNNVFYGGTLFIVLKLEEDTDLDE